jgi:agmatinase
MAPPYPYGEYERARVVILPVPYDSTTTARAGARDGPNAIIDNSEDMELFDVGLGYEPYLHGIFTSPSVAVTNETPEAMIDRVAGVAREFVDDGKFLVTLGGEHTVAVGAFRAHRGRYPNLSVLAIDAHADLRDEYQGTRYNHACSLRRMLDDVAVTQVGLRSASVEEAALIRERKLPFYSPRVFRALPDLSAIVDTLADYVYVTIDLDGIDSGEMPAVGTPEPGGLTWDEVSGIMEAVAKARRIVGFDLTELAPDLGPKSCAYAAAKLAYRLIGLALGPPEG